MVSCCSLCHAESARPVSPVPMTVFTTFPQGACAMVAVGGSLGELSMCLVHDLNGDPAKWPAQLQDIWRWATGIAP